MDSQKLVSKYNDTVVALCRKHLGSEWEDGVQDVWERILAKDLVTEAETRGTNLGSLVCLAAYRFVLNVKESYEQKRGRHARRIREGDIVCFPAETGVVLPFLQGKQAIIAKRLIEGKEQIEIAEELGVSPQAIHVYVKDIRIAIVRDLQEQVRHEAA